MTTQDQIAALWAKLLGVKNVAADDNFFALGGHSLLAVKMVAAVQQALGLEAELALSDLMENPTLGEFAAHVDALAQADEDSGVI